MFYDVIICDVIEIIFYSSALFALCKWLQTDNTKNIIGYFFGYCALTLCAWATQMPTLTPFLFTYAPVAFLLFIVLHEKTLQRNLVTLRNITPARIQHEDWLESLLSCSLMMMNANKKITIVIEHTKALQRFLVAPFYINADINKQVLDLLLLSTTYDEQKIIWVTTHGKIHSINATSLHDPLIYTTQSDAIVFNAHPISRTFTIIMGGKETRNLSAHHIHTMIKKQFSSLTASHHKGAYNEHNKSEKSLTL